MFGGALPWNRRRLRSHLQAEIGGASITYCYIRKNACSAFKRLLINHYNYQGEWRNAVGFLTRTCSAPNLAAARSAQWRIFVYRDPFDRAASLFRHKMIMQHGAENFLRNYREVTGADPASATFSSFVTDYLTGRKLDPHTRSQASHLLPIDYNIVSTPQTLLADMRGIFGDELAQRYFALPSNRSSASPFDDPSWDTSVHVLGERLAATGELPSLDALRTSELESIVQRLYRDDYALDPERTNRSAA
jgi:hypothetical protein